MSAVGAVGAGSSDSLWYQLYLQSLQGAGGATGASGAAAVAGSPTANASGDASSAGTTSTPPGTGSTVNLTDLRSQIETAVTQALNGATNTSDPGDLLQTVHQAIDSTLQANGIDPQQLQRHGHHGHHHRAVSDGSQSTGGASATTDPNATDPNAVDPNGDSDGTATSPGQGQDRLAILAILGNQNNPATGVSSSSAANSASNPPNTLAAVLATNNTSANGGFDLASLFGQLFATFPPGSGLNVQV
jgi:hypothetical protein